VSTSDDSYFARGIEKFIRFIEYFFGNGPIDVPWDIAINMVLFTKYASLAGHQMLLFDIEQDPEERQDISTDHPDIVKELLEKIEKIKVKRPHHPHYWMMSPNWTEGFIQGDCSGQDKIRQDECRFAHHWLPDEADVLDEDGLMLEDAFQMIIREDGPKLVFVVVITCIAIYFVLKRIIGVRKMKES
jgi:hypothetical protein